VAFNHQQYNTEYLLNIQNGFEPINDAAQKYGVRIIEADVDEGELYWRVIGVHHLLPRENFSKHNVYLEALDENGNRARNPIAWAGWTWKGRHPNERADPIPLDKPEFEAAGNIAMHFGQIVSTWINGLSRDAKDKSDRVENLHTAHPDEPTPDGALLNTLGHHSFYVVFQRTRKTSSMNDGLIHGRLERGQGFTVVLKKSNNEIARQTINSSLTFRFDNLSAGIYRLEVLNSDIVQDNIKLDPTNKEATLNLAIPLPDDSIIFGHVRNGAGKILLLIKEGNIIQRRRLPATGDYRFDNLAAGVYGVQVFETNVRQENISVDGINSREVNLIVPDEPIEPIEKSINHYLLFGPPGSRGRKVNLLLAFDFIETFSVTVGFSVEEAKHARQVTIIGEGISPADEQAIKDAGVQIERLSGDAYDIEAELTARIQAGRPFGG